MTIFSSFTCLVDSNEPVSSYRGPWGMREVEDSNLHTSPCYRHYEDENRVVEKSWHTSEIHDEMPIRSGSFSLKPSRSYLKQGGSDNYLSSEHSTVNVNKKNINTIKKKIMKFEEEFEATFGYRPSQSEKRKHKDIKKYLSELSIARKELKQMEDGVTSLDMREEGELNHQTAPYYMHDKDENGVLKNWHTGEDEVVSPNSGSISLETQNPHLNYNIGDNDLPTGHFAIKVFTKNINTLKKKIKQFEEEFETEYGHRPSQSEKRKNKDIRKYISELSKARKDLKQMKEGVSLLDSISSAQKLTTYGSHSMLKDEESANAASTLQQVEERLKEERSACDRQENMSEMTFNELQEEKTALQKALLYYENIHGRPSTREERELPKPLYDRYRQCKRNILRTGSRAKENIGDLAPIIEHETMHYTLDSPQHHCCIYEDEKDNKPSTTSIDEEDAFSNPYHILDKGEKISRLPLENVHSLPLHELKNRKKEAKDEKKQLRKALRNFEEQFEREYGRKFQKEDRGPMEQTYLDYKHAKAKLRLLEALLSKLETTQY